MFNSLCMMRAAVWFKQTTFCEVSSTSSAIMATVLRLLGIKQMLSLNQATTVWSLSPGTSCNLKTSMLLQAVRTQPGSTRIRIWTLQGPLKTTQFQEASASTKMSTWMLTDSARGLNNSWTSSRARAPCPDKLRASTPYSIARTETWSRTSNRPMQPIKRCKLMEHKRTPRPVWWSSSTSSHRQEHNEDTIQNRGPSELKPSQVVVPAKKTWASTCITS